MSQLSDMLVEAKSQTGKHYVFGAQPDPKMNNPPAFDCSGLTRWCLVRAGVPTYLGSWMQARACRDAGTEIPIVDALKVAGALLFRGPNKGYDGYGADGHVAFSLGDGTTMEARGAAWGVGSWTADPTSRLWTNAGLAPGLEYGLAPVPAPIPVPEPPILQEEENQMFVILPTAKRSDDPRFKGRWPGYTLDKQAREVWAWNDAPLGPYGEGSGTVTETQIPGVATLKLDSLVPGGLIDKPKDIGLSPDGRLVVLMSDAGTIDIRTF